MTKCHHLAELRSEKPDRYAVTGARAVTLNITTLGMALDQTN